MNSSARQHYPLSADQFTLPSAISRCPGIEIGGETVQSLLLTTNLDYIHNFDTDAILTIHPFEPSKKVNRAVLAFCETPVLCGIGGGLRNMQRAEKLAKDAENAGAAGVVITRPTAPQLVEKIRSHTSCKLIYTLVYEEKQFPQLISAGVDMFNISTGKQTPATIRTIKEHTPEIPIAANGGPFDSTIRETIRSGADAIVYNPPTATEIMRSIFDQFSQRRVMQD